MEKKKAAGLAKDVTALTQAYVDDRRLTDVEADAGVKPKPPLSSIHAVNGVIEGALGVVVRLVGEEEAMKLFKNIKPLKDVKSKKNY